MVGETSATKIDEATTAKVDKAEVVKAFKEAALVDVGRTVAEAASTSPRTGDQPGGYSGAREIHTISSDEPPRPHGKGVTDAEASSTTETAIPGVLEGPEVKGNLSLVPVETDPWAYPVPVFLGDSKKAEEAH
jgi:hypothetical protein